MWKISSAVWLLVVALNANGQTAGSGQPECSQPATGSLRARVYAWDWFKPNSGNNDYQYPGNIFRLNLCTTTQATDLNVEFAVPFMFALPTNAIGTGPQQGMLGFGANYFSANDGHRNVAMIFPKQLYAKFKLGGNKDNTLQLGRFTFLDGTEITPKDETLKALKQDRVNQRLLGDFGFSDVGRSFDGLHYSYSSSESNNLTVIAAVATRGVFQVDGWGWNRAGFGYAAYTQEWGTGHHVADTRAFVIEYDDWRRVLKTDNQPASLRTANTGNIVINTFGGHSIHALDTSSGTIDLMIWGVGQTGRWGVQKQRSVALEAEAGFQPKGSRLKPWVRGGYTWGSGDDNPLDNTHGTFFQLLPTPRPYARFPFFNMMNNADIYGAVILRPNSKVTIWSQFDSLRLASRSDLWYTGGGVFQPWTFGYTGRSTSGSRSLANLYDTSIEYRESRKVTYTVYFGYAQGLAVMEQIYPKGKNGKFGYAELLYRF
jgi:hypothetical protein